MNSPSFSKRTLRWLFGEKLAGNWVGAGLVDSHGVPFGPETATEGKTGERRSLMERKRILLDVSVICA